MRQILDPTALAPLLDAEPRWGCLIGGLPPEVAPADSIVWLRPLTVADGESCGAQAILGDGADTTAADQLAAVLAAMLVVDPQAWRLGPLEQARQAELDSLADRINAARDPDERDALQAERDALAARELRPAVDPERVVPLFSDWRDVFGLGDPTDGASTAGQLLVAGLQAMGLSEPETPDEAPPAETLQEMQARLRHRGRWCPGVFPHNPDAALWVRPCTEGERAMAREAAMCPVPGRDAHRRMCNDLAIARTLLSFCVRQGPGGPPLMTVNDVKRLPLGAARRLEYIVTTMTQAGEVPALRFRDEGPGSDGGVGIEPTRRGGGPAGLVGGGEAGSPAVRSDADAG